MTLKEQKEKNEKLAGRVRDLEEGLGKLEWCLEGMCPNCGHWPLGTKGIEKKYTGHHKDCWLKKLREGK